MFKITYHGKKNIVGENIYKLRKIKFPKMSQRQFAEKLQILGMDVGKNRISDIESGKSFVTDIEVKIIAELLDVSTDFLLSTKEDRKKHLYSKDLSKIGELEIAQYYKDEED